MTQQADAAPATAEQIRAILEPGDRLYFIHIPKTAGTTLIPLLDDRFHAEEICPAQLWPELLALPQEDLPKYRFFRGHFGARGLDVFLPAPPVSITLLRHPVSLAFSTYRFILREPETPLYRLVKAQRMTFDDFVHHPKTRPAISNTQMGNLCFTLRYQPGTGPALSGFRRQSQWAQWLKQHKVVPPPRDRLAHALTNLRRCAFFGLVERFDESMALMAWTFGWPPLGHVQKLRVAPRFLGPQEVSAPLASQVRACNKLDLELYRAGETVFAERLASMLVDLRRYTAPGEVVPESFAENPALIHKLLDRHHQACRSAHCRDAENGFRASFAPPLQGSGWHAREISPHDGSVYRWTGPGTVSTLDVRVHADEDLIVTFLVIDVVNPVVLKSIRLAVNGHPVMLRRIGGRTTAPVCYQTRVSRDLLPARPCYARFSFRVAKTESWHWVRTDTRAVGVAINWVDVRPESLALPDEAWAYTLKTTRRPRTIRQFILRTPLLGVGLRALYMRIRATRRLLSGGSPG
jgi:hypothetical protein